MSPCLKKLSSKLQVKGDNWNKNINKISKLTFNSNGWFISYNIKKRLFETCLQFICQLSGVGGGDGGGKAHPQKVWNAKNRGKIRENLSKIYENLCKIPENLGKLPESSGKNGTQRCMILKSWRSICAQSHEDLFLEVIPKDGVHDLCGRKY